MKQDEKRVFNETWKRLSETQEEGAKVTDVLEDFDPSLGRGEGQGGDSVKPADLVGMALLVKVSTVQKEIKTSYGEKDAVDVDIAGVANGKVARGLRWFNPAVVDALRPYEGKVVPLKLAWVTGNSGRAYLTAESLSEIENAAAKALYAKGDPFAPEEPDPVAKGEAAANDEGPRW